MRKLIVSAMAVAVMLTSGISVAEAAQKEAHIKLKAWVKTKCDFTKPSQWNFVHFGKVDPWVGSDAKQVELNVKCNRKNVKFDTKSEGQETDGGLLAMNRVFGFGKIGTNVECQANGQGPFENFNPGTFMSVDSNQQGFASLNLRYQIPADAHMRAGLYKGVHKVKILH